ncbi:MAG: hypothetical protein ABSD62_13485 [Candidatus Limnocylindrales bacterium]|jgi:hypothetical protein
MLGVQSGGPLAAPRPSRGTLRVAESSALPEPTVCAEAVAPAVDLAARGRPAGDATEERDAWVVLLAVPGLGPVTFAGLLAAFGSARATLAAASGPNGAARLQEAVADRVGVDESDVDAGCPAASDRGDHAEPLSRVGPDAGGSQLGRNDASCETGTRRALGGDLANRIRLQAAEADRALAVVRALDLAVVTLDDPEYPERLRRVDMPPPFCSSGALWRR